MNKYSQKGQITIVLAIFLLSLFFISSFKGKVSQKDLGTFAPGACTTIPQGAEEVIELPPINGSSLPSPTKFVKVRTNIPINQNFYLKDKHYKVKLRNFKHPNGKTYDVYYPGKLGSAGEICYPSYIHSKYRHADEGPERTKCSAKQGGGYKLYFPDFGIIFLVEKDPSTNQRKKETGLDDRNQEATFFLSELYQQENELKGIGTSANPLPADALACSTVNTPSSSPGIVNDPDQKKSPDKKELQLESFVFDTGVNPAPNGWTTHCKPAIYLYPKEKTLVNVKVNTKGFLTYVDPPYPANGWSGIAYPDGKILVNGKSYPYLYYESRVPDELIEKPDRGYVVPFNELSNFYQILLPQLGLNQTQTKDFTDYWEKALPYAPYYFVGVMDQENINEFEPLEITPKPDLSIRVRLYFEALDKKPSGNLQLPILSSPITHYSSLKLIEWGGMVKNNPLEPFTCSQ